MGDWNEMKIRVVGSRVTTWLNGTEMIDLMDEKIGEATGHIALQIHDGGGSRYGGGTCGWWSTKACGEPFGEWSRTRPTFKDLRVSAFSGIAMGDHEDGFRPPSPLHRQPSLKKASAEGIRKSALLTPASSGPWSLLAPPSPLTTDWARPTWSCSQKVGPLWNRFQNEVIPCLVHPSGGLPQGSAGSQQSRLSVWRPRPASHPRPWHRKAHYPASKKRPRTPIAWEGFFTLYWEDSSGSLYWEIDKLGTEFLYQISMGSGLGSNPVGIDRGQLRGTHILEPRRIGPRVLLMEPNYRFRARSDNPMEAQAVRDAFAPSVHWGFDIVAETGDRVLVDATEFFLRDARGVVEQIAQRNQGRFELDRSRSAIHLPATRSFPDNTEVEAILTFTSAEPGGTRPGRGGDRRCHHAPAAPLLHPATR